MSKEKGQFIIGSLPHNDENNKKYIPNDYTKIELASAGDYSYHGQYILIGYILWIIKKEILQKKPAFLELGSPIPIFGWYSWAIFLGNSI